jgi:FkbM family methyltransferase
MIKIIRNSKFYLKNTKYYLALLGFTGLLSFIKSRVTKKNVFFKVREKGLGHPLTIRIPTWDVATFEKVFVDREYGFSVLSPPKIIIDAGANIGLASIYFANRFPEARIIAIEPEGENYALLVENLAPYPNVIPLQAAVWNKNGVISLVDPGQGTWGYMTEVTDAPEGALGNYLHAVQAFTIDRIIQDFQLGKVDILKVDIEGAEKEVFSDTSSWIGNIDSIIIELHDHIKPRCSDSFYRGAVGFDGEWKQGENVFLSRRNCLTRV